MSYWQKGKKFVALVYMCCCVIGLCCACSTSDQASLSKKSIVGTWAIGNDGATIIFRDNGTCEYGSGYYGMRCTGYTCDDTQIVISYANENSTVVRRKCFVRYQLSGDRNSLTIIDETTRNYREDGSVIEGDESVSKIGVTFKRVD